MRLCERDAVFGHEFVEEARSVYLCNDRRAVLKRKINELLGASPGEPEVYAKYQQEAA